MRKTIKIIMLIALLILSPVIVLLVQGMANGPMSEAEFETRLPVIVNGLQAQVEGDGDDTLVFIHGYPDSLEMWDKQVAFFKRDHTVARITLPGFELQDLGARPQYTLVQMRRIIDAYIESLNKDKVTVIAHDWGAVYASQYLASNPLVDRLVLLDVGSFGNEAYPEINMKYTAALALAWLLPEPLGEKLVAYTANEILGLVNVDPNKPSADFRFDARMTYPYWQLWRSILLNTKPEPVPVDDYATAFLFLYGQDKQVWFHSQSWINEVTEKQKGEAEAMPGGHWFMLSSPELVNQSLSMWLARHPI
ncbi:alpha/beta hydrolase [Vibrio tubiashii]|uniref:Alpha/beta hydrolase n=2 Tax=Vibrio oreintalis group TaxID=1891919 RepID=A0AAE5GQ69_9VIBR|nr:alpha/beta hydrolase [Vibrio tubiashii]NOI80966.1 alpha/beta hydrolase [Vibrio tubiashii]